MSAPKCPTPQEVPLEVAEATKKKEVLPAPADPMRVARKVLTDWTHDGISTLLSWRGGWMRWRESCWVEIEEAELRSLLYKRLEAAQYIDSEGALRDWAPNRRKVADVAAAVAGITHTPETVDTPSWLTKGNKVRAGQIVACSNGLLDVGTRELMAHTPAYFNTVAVPFAYEADAPEPARWLEFLAQLWPEDPEAIEALQQWFGYVLSGRTDLQKILLLVGPTRSGKGTLARVLAALVGRGNTAGPTLASLGTNFGLAPLLGKPLALVSDARLGGANTHQVVERLLSISGEDYLTIDRKFRETWTGKLSSRFVLMSNELPRFGDASGAIAGRFLVLTMQTSFMGKENTRLTDQLLEELPGILRWSLDGLDRLTVSGFTVPQSSQDATTMLQDLVSPVAAFVRDRCIRGPQERERVQEMFEQWKLWCEDNGHRSGSAQTFGRDLRAVVSNLTVTQPRDATGKQVRTYQGVRLRTDADENDTHNGPVRVSSVSTPPPDTPDTDDTRNTPLSAEHTDDKTCPRWQDCDTGNCHAFRKCVKS